MYEFQEEAPSVRPSSRPRPVALKLRRFMVPYYQG